MLKYLLKSADLSALGGGLGNLLNPELISAIPAGGMFELAGSLLQATLPGGKPEFERRMAELAGKARDAGLALQIGGGEPSQPASPRASGEAVLQLYFFQILSSTTWILDFRNGIDPLEARSSLSPAGSFMGGVGQVNVLRLLPGTNGTL